MQLGLKNVGISPPGELSLPHESYFSLCFHCTRWWFFFLPSGFISKQDTSQDVASHCSFYLFVACQGEFQWEKNLRGDQAQRWPSKVTYLGTRKIKNPPLCF